MSEPAAPHDLPWLTLPVVGAAVLGLTALKLYVAGRAGLVFDEGYYTLWSTHLSAGYLDHPPAVAAMIAGGRALFGNTPFGVRGLAVLSNLLLALLIWRTGERLLDRPTALLATLWYAVSPAAGLGFITTPDPPSALFWMATLWAVAEFVAGGNAGWWLLAGLLAGLGLWSKYTDAFLVPGLLLFLIAGRERRAWLRHWQVWAAPAVALAVFLPVIVWNARHGWASFLFQGRRIDTDGIGADVLGNLADLAGGQALYMTPVLFAFALAGMALYLRRPGNRNDARPARRGLALPVLTTLPALAYFLFHATHGQVDANWLIPLWPPLSLAAAWAALALLRRRQRLFALANGTQLLLGVALTLLIYVQAIAAPFSLGALDRTSETRGWADFTRRLETLATANGARWIATRSDYAATGQIAASLLFAGSALPVRQIDEAPRWTFLPPFSPQNAGRPALYVVRTGGGPAPAPTAYFRTITPLGTLTRNDRSGPLDRWAAFLVRDPTPAVVQSLGN